MKAKKNRSLEDYGKSISKALEKYEKPIKLAVTVIAIVAALVFFGEKGEKDLVYEVSNSTVAESTKEEDTILDTTSSKDISSSKEPEHILEQRYITVDISGEVINPGVYTLEEGSRLFDLIAMAGGLSEKGDIDAINRASTISDGMKIYIPSIEDDWPVHEGSGSSFNNNTSSKKVISINNGSMEDLQSIPGIGPVTAERIIKYREIKGNFNSIEEIKNVSGIGDKTFEQIKDYISI